MSDIKDLNVIGDRTVDNNIASTRHYKTAMSGAEIRASYTQVWIIRKGETHLM
jgi:hypothetical protein